MIDQTFLRKKMTVGVPDPTRDASSVGPERAV